MPTPETTTAVTPSSADKSRRMRRKKQKLRRRKLWLYGTVATIVAGCALVIAAVLVGFLTPWGNRTRLLMAETIASTRHYQFARYITTSAEYASILKALNGIPVVSSSGNGVHVSGTTVPHQIQIIPLSQNGFTGYVMLVRDPKLIRLVPAQVVRGEGEYISNMIPRVGAIAGTNASGFEDPKGEGWGGIPVGLEYVDGHVMQASKDENSWATVGFTKAGVMVMGRYSVAELQGLGVRDAMQFHPELVVDGQPTITQGDGGWGQDPRTAIGQAKDGTVIFVVINGRLHDGSIGATQRDVMNLMLQYGAINACAMDGGSSSVLYDEGGIKNSPSTIDPNGERHLPDAWLVFPSETAANQVTTS